MRLATDTGGTFTDLIVEDDDGSISLYKAATVPSDPVSGVLDALTIAADARGLSVHQLLGRASTFIHGTTHALNAIITGRTARTALIVSEGHRDILLFREGGRTDPFDHQSPYPAPYVPRSLTFELRERVLASGAVMVPLDGMEVADLLGRIKEERVEAIAVCLLWSTIRPDHELEVGALIEKHLPGIPYTLSHAVNATLREFRRASSAAIDASLKPLMGRYLGSLTDRLASAGFGGNVMVLTSSGGMVEASEICNAPIKVINSGPSMAPVAGRYYVGREGGPATAIVADTGGTTYDISLVSDGRIPMTRDLWIGRPFHGHLAGYPSVDVKSVGAGGGSLATIDKAGLLHVGPQSAGSYPGPVCYGRGGTGPTVSDACLVLGFLDPDFFLGGKMKLDAPAARAAIAEQIAEPLGLSVEEAAWSVVDLATENMVQAIAELTVNQGIDPSEAVLVGGGGAAGLNSVFIARRLGCRQLLIPETGAAMSAAGAMMSDIVTDFAATVYSKTDAFDAARVNAVLDGLRAKAEAYAAEAGLPSRLEFIAEARYEGQAWDIDVPLTFERFVTDADVTAFRGDFDRAHEQLFTIRDEESSVELIGLRVTVRCGARTEEGFILRAGDEEAAGERSRPVYFAGSGAIETPILAWSKLKAGLQQAGPAIIESPFTTVVVDPAARFSRTLGGALLIET